MKFEKFMKMITPYGTILKDGGENWIMSMGCVMKCPDHVRPIGSEVLEMPEKIKDILDPEYWIGECELVKAYLPEADGKTSDLIRVFADPDGGKIGILNKMYGLIEKNDALNMVYVDGEPVAMTVENHDGIVGAFIKHEYLRGE